MAPASRGPRRGEGDDRRWPAIPPRRWPPGRPPAPPARKRAPRAAATPDKAVEAGIASSAAHAHTATHPHGPEAFGAAIGGFLNSLSGLQVPQTTLSELQEQYVNQATALWNGAGDQIPVGGDAAKPAVPKPIGDRRFSAQDWLGHPA